MDVLLKVGTQLTSQSGNVYTVKGLLGAGGQGEVYNVECGKTNYALKWYFPKMATTMQKKILDNLIAKGSPDPCFLWPEDLIFAKDGSSFGYIMELRGKNFKGIVDLMKRRAEPSFAMLCRAAYNLTSGYQKLHSMGFSYRDISFGNVFFDPDTGDVRICDNDNVSPNGEYSSVYGTPRFMAPEIVTGKAKPSRNTDQYSLAVLLFYMFMLGHPLDGKREAEIKCLDTFAMNKLYGTDPLFVFDPQDKSNRPVKGYHDNVLIYWDLYPKELKDLFTTSFTIGLTEPNKRITEKEWMRVLANMISGIVKCPKCGCEVFIDEAKEKLGVSNTCWSCGSNIPPISKITIGKNRVLLTRDGVLYSHAINNDYDIDTVCGRLVQNPNNPNMWGLRNETNVNWTYLAPDGSQAPIAPGRSAGIAKNIKIDFGKSVGEIT